MLSPSGMVSRVRIANSYFLENSVSLLSGSILQLTAIDDNVGGEGGAAINALNIGTQVATPLKTSSGSTHTVPTGSIPGLVGEVQCHQRRRARARSRRFRQSRGSGRRSVQESDRAYQYYQY